MKNALLALLIPALLSAGTIRVNAGGPAYTDAKGNIWAADTNANGVVYSTAAQIAKTSDPALYRTERYCAGCTLEYSFPVANGAYGVILKFAEIYFTSAGQRVFNIAINGAVVTPGFDIFKASGAANTAIDQAYPVTVTTGMIDIQLQPVVQNPKISAIEIDQISIAPPPITRVRNEVPVSGAVHVWTLAHAPDATGATCFDNGLRQQPGADYTLAGATLTSATWRTSDALACDYEY